MADKNIGVFARYAKKFSSVEEMEAYKVKLSKERQESQNIEIRKEEDATPNPSVALSVSTKESEHNNSFLPMLHGKATDSIAAMIGKPIREDRVNNTGIIDNGGVKLTIDKLNELVGKLGVSTHKLLSMAIALFTANNHTGTNKKEIRCTEVIMPLKEYALLCGYNVTEHATETKEEAAKEAIRAKQVLDNARRKINKDLALIYSLSLSWSEKVRNKQGDYVNVRLIEAEGIRSGYICIKFSQTFSSYLIGLPLTQFPKALLRIDERNANAYTMGLKMAEHYSMDNNQIVGTAQLLKVCTLLSQTNLPSIETVRAQNHDWVERIKEPFEKALELLTNCGFLSDWEYSHSKGVAMTDKEATNWGGYEEWANGFLVHFSIKDAPDATKRLEARAKKVTGQTKKSKKSH